MRVRNDRMGSSLPTGAGYLVLPQRAIRSKRHLIGRTKRLTKSNSKASITAATSARRHSPNMHTILHLAVTQDGYIARSNGDSSWVSHADEELFMARARDAGCLVVGRTTFEQYRGTIYPVSGALN